MVFGNNLFMPLVFEAWCGFRRAEYGKRTDQMQSESANCRAIRDLKYWDSSMVTEYQRLCSISRWLTSHVDKEMTSEAVLAQQVARILTYTRQSSLSGATLLSQNRCLTTTQANLVALL